MSPRWPMFVLFLLAGVPLVLSALLDSIMDVSLQTIDALWVTGILVNGLVFVACIVDLLLSPSLRQVEVGARPGT